MSQNLTKFTKRTRVMNAIAAGTTDQNSSSVDMQNFEGVVFTALLGTLSSSQVTQMKLQASSDDGVADGWSDLLGTQTAAMDDADDNQGIVSDLFKPLKRYVRAVLERGTGNAVIDGIIAEQYGPRTIPTTNDATTIQATETHISPAEGTA